MEIPSHIQKAIVSAKKCGYKKVKGIVGGMSEHQDNEKKINSGDLECFLHDGIHLLREPVKDQKQAKKG